MVLIPLLCPHCRSDQVIKGGKTETGKQRYRCQQTDCSHRSFVLDPAYNGRLPHIKAQMIDMALNGGALRDTARVRTASHVTRTRHSTAPTDVAGATAGPAAPDANGPTYGGPTDSGRLTP